MPRDTILLVDDESRVLYSLARSLLAEDFYVIHTAQSGDEALELINKTPKLAVIVTDFKMPGMNGVELLEKAREVVPDTTRILLTGVAALDMAVESVNRGSVFRFLLKPCAPETFVAAVREGVRQNQLVNAEKELLTQTLSGSVKVMMDILSAISPEVFARSSRLTKMAREMANALELPDRAWELELAAMLCQIGAVTVPQVILQHWQSGMILDTAEREMIDSIPQVGSKLLQHIPRLENIAEAVLYQNLPYFHSEEPNVPSGEGIALGARILKLIIDFDHYQEVMISPSEAFHMILQHKLDYDPHLMDLFERRVLPLNRVITPTMTRPGERKVKVEDLKVGMELSRDIVDKNGILIVSKGTIVSDVLKYKLGNFFRLHALVEPVFIQSDW